ncbi:Hypothetical predicted protein, partial [Paramuricea clavata]
RWYVEIRQQGTVCYLANKESEFSFEGENGEEVTKQIISHLNQGVHASLKASLKASNLAGVEVLDLQDSRAISLSDNDTTNGSFQACGESVSCDEESVIQNVIKHLDSLTRQFENHRTETSVVLNELVNIYENQKSPTATENLTKENRLLKEENKALQTELTKYKDTLTELNTKLTDTESEKSSLLTVIRLLNEEQATVMCSNKDESSQAQQTRSSWQIAGRKTISQSAGHHINLSNKYSTLQIEDDDEAVMSGDAGNNQTLVPKKTPTIDHEKKRRLKNTPRNIQDTKQNSLPISNQRDTIQPKKQQCDVALVGDSMIKHVDVRKLRHGTNKQ